MKPILRALAVACFLMAAPLLHGQQPMVSNYAQDDYNGGKQNWWIDTTASGVMLFANDQGLLTFDSQEWRTYPLGNFSTVRCIRYDHDKDIIYAGGTNDFGYFAHNPTTGRLAYHSLVDQLPEPDRNFGEMWAIFRCDNGNYVFSAKHHVFVMKPDGTFTPFHVKEDILCAALSPMGTILACREVIYTIRNMQLQVLPGTEQMKGEIPLSIIPYEGKVLFGTAHHGFFIYDGKTTQPYELSISPYIKEHQLFCATLQDDVLAVGTVRGGLAVQRLRGKSQSVAGKGVVYANLQTGLQNNTVLSMRFDRQGGLWLGLDQGIAHVMIDAPYLDLLGSENRYGTGYTSLVDGNRLLLGTNQGLFSTPWPLPYGAVPPTPTLLQSMIGQVWSLRRVEGTILCGGNRGAWQVTAAGSRRIEGLAGTWDFIPVKNHPATAICCDYNGLAVLRLAGGEWQLSHRIKGFDNASGSLIEGADGSIWMSHWQQGIFRLTLNDELTEVKAIQMFNKGNGLPCDDNNLVARIGEEIVITAADGFHHFVSTTSTIEPNAQLNQLFGIHENRLRLQEGPRGEIWAFNNNLMILAKKGADGRFEADSVTFRQIARSLQHVFGHVSFTPDGQIILNANKGFVLAYDRPAPHHQRTHLFVRRITSTNTGDSVLYEAQTTAWDSLHTPRLVIPKGQNSLRIEFVLPEYTAENGVRYDCWLEGYDHTWSNVTANEKEYTRLPRGSYRLHVRCLNRMDGQTEETVFDLRILPAWYETWWAFLLYALLTLYVLHLLARYVRNRYERKIQQADERRKQELKEQEMQFEMERQRQEHETMRLKNEQLEMELKHKSSQLADSTMNLIRKNDMLQQLDERMSDLSESVRREDPKARQVALIRDIRAEISTHTGDDEHWDTFEQNFNLVYDNFLMKLTARFPTLKLPDRKLCAYIKMGLSSKDIASLLNSSVRSIETARYRLRKKLELEQGENLQDFLQNYQG